VQGVIGGGSASAWSLSAIGVRGGSVVFLYRRGCALRSGVRMGVFPVVAVTRQGALMSWAA
jgi:hypothetical protein